MSGFEILVLAGLALNLIGVVAVYLRAGFLFRDMCRALWPDLQGKSFTRERWEAADCDAAYDHIRELPPEPSIDGDDTDDGPNDAGPRRRLRVVPCLG